MVRNWFKLVLVCSIAVMAPSCGQNQQLVSITIEPATETFGASNIPVAADAGLNVQLRALGNYIHPPVVKDITNQVAWASNTPEMVTANSTGLITATGLSCGSALVSATLITNNSGGAGSTGAIVTGNMTASVVCFTGTAPAVTVNFLGTGSGTVVSSPPGIDCTTNCTVNFPNGTAITLTATPNGTFGGWTGNCDQIAGNVCTIFSLASNRTVDATFN